MGNEHFSLMLNRQYLGIKGESTARDFLRRHGYQIRASGWRFKRLEIDIIASYEDVLVFVEVKTRMFNPFGLPDDGLSRSQIGNICRAARAYMENENWDGYWQFDLISVEWRGDGNYTLRHLKDLPFIE